MMNINELIINKHLSDEKLTCFPGDLIELEKKAIFEVLSVFCSSAAMNNTEVWKEIAVLGSKHEISSDLMLVIGITKLMRGEVCGLLWLRSNLAKFPSGRNLHAYYIALCQFDQGKEKVKPFLDAISAFALSEYQNYFSFANSVYVTTTSSVLQYKNKNIFITLENSFRNACMRDIFLNGYWTLEPELEWIETILSSKGVLIDIGANAGVYTLCGSKIVGEKGVVYSFEPNAICIDLLKKSIRLNKMNNITLIPEAVSNRIGVQDFILYAASDHNRIKFSNEVNSVHRSTITGATKVRVTTLDGYFENKNLTRLDLIKIDAEGCEKFVLESGSQIINHFRPKLIIEINERLFSSNGYNTGDLLDMLKCMNYSIFRLCPNQLVPLDENTIKDKGKSFNVIAISKK